MLLIFDLKTTLQETPLAQANLQPFLQAKFVKIMRAEICKINQHLSKVLYFTVLLHILQCAQVTYIMLTHHMKASPTYSNFHLKITRKCVENQHRKSDQHFLPPRPVLEAIWTPKNRSKIMSKSQKIVWAAKKRRLGPPKASKKAADPSASLQKGSRSLR